MSGAKVLELTSKFVKPCLIGTEVKVLVNVEKWPPNIYTLTTGVTSPDRHVRTRLYFTSESHIHSLHTILSEGGLIDVSMY